MRYPLFLFQPVAFGDAKETRTPIDGVKGRFPNLLEDGTAVGGSTPTWTGTGSRPTRGLARHCLTN